METAEKTETLQDYSDPANYQGRATTTKVGCTVNN